MYFDRMYIELCKCIYKRSSCQHCHSNHSMQWIIQLEINKTITINNYWIHCRIHVLAGMKPDNCNEAEMESTFIKNVTLAAKKFQPVCAPIFLSLTYHYYIYLFIISIIIFNVNWWKGFDIIFMLMYISWFLWQEGITCLIEPLNSRITAPRYFLTDVNKGNVTVHIESIGIKYGVIMSTIILTAYWSSSIKDLP